MEEATVRQHSKQLRLPTIAAQFRRMAEEAVREKQTHVRYLEALLQAEVEERERHAVERRLREARPAISHVVWGADCYLVPWKDGSVLVGATVEDVGFDERVTVDGVRQLLERSARLVPALAEATFVDARAGLRPATADQLPIVGASTTMRGVFYATGHYRNGVLLAPLTASLVADLVLEGRERPELTLVRPDRFGL